LLSEKVERFYIKAAVFKPAVCVLPGGMWATERGIWPLICFIHRLKGSKKKIVSDTVSHSILIYGVNKINVNYKHVCIVCLSYVMTHSCWQRLLQMKVWTFILILHSMTAWKGQTLWRQGWLVWLLVHNTHWERSSTCQHLQIVWGTLFPICLSFIITRSDKKAAVLMHVYTVSMLEFIFMG